MILRLAQFAIPLAMPCAHLVNVSVCHNALMLSRPVTLIFLLANKFVDRIVCLANLNAALVAHPKHLLMHHSVKLMMQH